MSNKNMKRDQQLLETISQERLDKLTEEQKDVLHKYFSPIDLKKMGMQNDTMFDISVQKIMFGVLKHKLTHISSSELLEYWTWYLDNATEINEIICPKCKNRGAIEVAMIGYTSDSFFGLKSVKRHPDGRFIVYIDDYFLASRCRLDGEIGLQCLCGNDTRWSSEELEVIPRKSVLSQLSMEDLQNFKQYEDLNGRKNYRKKLKNGNLLVDNFEFKKVK